MAIGRPRTFDYNQMQALLDEGKDPVKVAKELGVTIHSVKYAMNQKDKHNAIVSTAAFEHGRELTARHLDTVNQLKAINEHTNGILELIMEAIKGDQTAIDLLNQDSNFKRKDPNEIALKAVAEIREQLLLQNKVFETLYSLQQTQAFQEEVLSVLEAFEPGLRTRILSALKEKRLLHSATQWKDKK